MVEKVKILPNNMGRSGSAGFYPFDDLGWAPTVVSCPFIPKEFFKDGRDMQIYYFQLAHWFEYYEGVIPFDIGIILENTGFNNYG